MSTSAFDAQPRDFDGRFGTKPHGEPSLALVATAPEAPTYLDVLSAYPNAAQADLVYNARLYACATHTDATPDQRLRACRAAVIHQLETTGEFASLPSDDGESRGYALAGLRFEGTTLHALEQVGDLPELEAQHFADHLAGALYDIESAEREHRRAVIAQDAPPRRVYDDADGWPAHVPVEPPSDED